MLKHIILASAIGLVATPAVADPDKDESGMGRSEWRDDRRMEIATTAGAAIMGTAETYQLVTCRRQANAGSGFPIGLQVNSRHQLAAAGQSARRIAMGAA